MVESEEQPPSPERKSRWRPGCITVFLAGLVLMMVPGPLAMRGESNWVAATRVFLSTAELKTRFLEDRFDEAGVKRSSAAAFLHNNPSCCDLDAVSYNPVNWFAWHMLGGWKGSPAWLAEVNFGFEQDGTLFGYHSFGRVTNGGGYLTEYGDGAKYLMAVSDAEYCPVVRLPSGVTVVRNEPKTCLSTLPDDGRGSVVPIQQMQFDELRAKLAAARSECLHMERKDCYGPILLMHKPTPAATP